MYFTSFLGLGADGFHRIAYTDWGDPSSPHVVICVPGLTRNARDFDYLSRALQSRCRLLCMDVVGRGRSDWLEHKKGYGFRQYQYDAATLLAIASASLVRSRWFGRARRHAPERTIDWIGTSMGGLVGMLLAAQPNTPLRRLVLNDVGPFIPWAALARLSGYVGRGRRFQNLEELEAYVREVCAGFGQLEDAQWRHLAVSSGNQLPSGEYELAYDPGIVESLWSGADLEIPFGIDLLRGVSLWETWDRVRCDTLVLRGTDSDVLTAETASEMARRGPPARVVELAGVGHAPALMSSDQIGIIRDFLLR